MKKTISITALALVLVLMLSACGNALQKGVEEAQKLIPSLEEASGGLYKISIEAEGSDTLSYKFKFTEDIDVEETRAGLEATDFSGIVASAKATLEAAGVKNSKIKLAFYSKDDEEVFNGLY